MPISETIARSGKSSAAGRRERLVSPGVVQTGRAVRHAGEQRWARTTQSATATDHITCNLLDSAGASVEQIEVYCLLMNTTSLNEATPRLPTNQMLPVSYYIDQWWCPWPFDGDEDCVCTPAE